MISVALRWRFWRMLMGRRGERRLPLNFRVFDGVWPDGAPKLKNVMVSGAYHDAGTRRRILAKWHISGERYGVLCGRPLHGAR